MFTLQNGLLVEEKYCGEGKKTYHLLLTVTLRVVTTT